MAEQVAEDLEERISRAQIHRGEALPPNKALQYQYRTSFRTVRKAMEILIQKELAHSKGYRTIAGKETHFTSQARNRIILTGEQSTLFGEGSFGSQFYSSFAGTVQRDGFRIQRALLYQPTVKTIVPSPESVANAHGVLCLLSAGTQDRIEKTGLGELCRGLERLQKSVCPMVLHCQSPYAEEFIHRTRRFRDFFVVGISRQKAGEEVGRYLAEQGHHSVGFFSFSHYTWNRERFEEFKTGHQLVLNERSNIFRFAADFDIHDLRNKTQAEHRDELLEVYVEGAYATSRFSTMDPRPRIRSLMFELITKDRAIAAMNRLFDLARRNRKITAWVCVDPAVATLALDYIRAKRIRFPGELTLISIGDSHALQARGVSAFDFDAEQMGYVAAQCILKGVPVRRARNGIVESPGRIVERGSVAPKTGGQVH